MRLEEQETQAKSSWLKRPTKKSNTISDLKLFLDQKYTFLDRKKTPQKLFGKCETFFGDFQNTLQILNIS